MSAVMSVVGPSISELRNCAETRPGIGLNRKLIAGLCAAFFGHPRGDAAGAVAADFCDGAVGVVEADAAG
jgi:hypothetical protein